MPRSSTSPTSASSATSSQSLRSSSPRSRAGRASQRWRRARVPCASGFPPAAATLTAPRIRPSAHRAAVLSTALAPVIACQPVDRLRTRRPPDPSRPSSRARREPWPHTSTAASAAAASPSALPELVLASPRLDESATAATQRRSLPTFSTCLLTSAGCGGLPRTPDGERSPPAGFA
jgi:hypothetical protein